MTNTNMSWINKPFMLQPVGKDYLWGGNRLNEEFSKAIEMEPLAETWECSTHPDGVSQVVSGEHAGHSLTEVLQENPSYLGTHPRTKGELPILIKFIDARRDLSVQVHPDDAYAREHENGAMGKSEMWYVLEATKDASLVYGFNREVSRDVLRSSIEQGTVEKYLRKVPVKTDDVFYLEAGTVHAIGAGSLIIEVQQSSNLTYRLYDYDRVDRQGRKRPLQVEKALEVAALDTADASLRQPLRVTRYTRGCATELLCRCKYFQTERLLINTERLREMADFQTDANSFQVLVCSKGCGVMLGQGMEPINFFKGDTIFIPACSIPLKLHGKAQFLKVSC